MSWQQVLQLVITMIMVTSFLIGCGSTTPPPPTATPIPPLIGKWALVDQSLICYPIRGFKKIEFFNDQTVVYYDIFSGQERSAGVTANYSLPDEHRVKINVQALLGGTDLLNYEISGNTLRLCNGNDCCDLIRE